DPAQITGLFLPALVQVPNCALDEAIEEPLTQPAWVQRRRSLTATKVAVAAAGELLQRPGAHGQLLWRQRGVYCLVGLAHGLLGDVRCRLILAATDRSDHQLKVEALSAQRHAFSMLR